MNIAEAMDIDMADDECLVYDPSTKEAWVKNVNEMGMRLYRGQMISDPWPDGGIKVNCVHDCGYWATYPTPDSWVDRFNSDQRAHNAVHAGE